jgi:hypothetical protein
MKSDINGEDFLGFDGPFILLDEVVFGLGDFELDLIN